MSLSFDLYVERESWLHRLDPRTKLIFAILSMAVLLGLANLWIILAFLAAIQGALICARLPRERILWGWKVLAPVLVLVPLLWPVFYQEGGPLISLWLLRVTDLSLVRGVAVALRIAAMAFACFVPLLTTTQTELVQGLMRLGVPYRAGLLVAMALRYVGVFYGSFAVIMDAQQARGLDLSRGNLFQRLRAYLPILVAMLITCLRTADRVAMALEARGYGSSRRRTVYHQLRFRRADWLALGVSLAALTALAFARFAFGFGSHPWLL